MPAAWPRAPDGLNPKTVLHIGRHKAGEKQRSYHWKLLGHELAQERGFRLSYVHPSRPALCRCCGNVPFMPAAEARVG